MCQDDIRIDEQQIYIRSEVAKGTRKTGGAKKEGRPRLIEGEPLTIWKWLERYPELNTINYPRGCPKIVTICFTTD